MKYYQILYKNLAAIGFIPIQQQNTHWPLNVQQIFCIFKYSTDVIFIGVYVFCKADGIDQYMVTTFALTVLVGIALSFLSMIFKNEKLFDMIEVAIEEMTFSKFFSVLHSFRFQ